MGDVLAGGNGRRPRVDRGRPGSAVLTPPTGLPPVGEPVVPSRRMPGPDDASTIDRTRVTPPPTAPTAPCACGHGRDAHEHFRPGADCGACGAVGCVAYRPVGGPLRRLLRSVGLVG